MADGDYKPPQDTRWVDIQKRVRPPLALLEDLSELLTPLI